MAEKEYSSLNEDELKDLFSKIKTNKLIKDGSLDLDVFNKNLNAASNNLGIIIPSIIDVSKEQVAIINHGLEGVINFIRAFQTVNTTFAVMVESSDDEDKFKNFINKLDVVTNLEQRIVSDVKDTLVNLDNLLRETMMETAVYYSALAKIIYSETDYTGKTYDISYERSFTGKSGEIFKSFQNKLKKERQEQVNKKFKLEESLGLVQLIKSLDEVSKVVKTIKIDEKEIQQSYITGIKAGIKVDIPIDVDVISALKSLSGELLNSLNRVGLLVQDQNKEVRVLEASQFMQHTITQFASQTASKVLKNINEDINIVKFFKKQVLAISEYSNIEVDTEKKLKLYNKIRELRTESENAKKVHDDIIKNQTKHIITIVKAFAEVIAIWGQQVDGEIHIGQVADKAVIALKKLTEVEVKIDPKADTDSLLLTIETQKSIQNTCETAKDLKHVGKVMTFLLERVKALISFNEHLERDIRSFHSKTESAEKYKEEKTKHINELIFEKYPRMSKQVSTIIKNFNNKLETITESRNIFESRRLFTEFETHYSIINIELENFKNQLVKVNSDEVNADNFEDLCKGLGIPMEGVEEKMKGLFNAMNSLTKTFSDDFENYMAISNAYREFVKELSPMLDLIRYVIDAQKKMVSEKIELRVVNYKIKAFEKIFENIETSQKKQAEIELGLHNVMKEVGMSDSAVYYSQYTEKLNKEFNNLFKEMQEYIKSYFSDEAKMKQAYESVENWIKKYDVDFSDYNKKLKSMNVGFFQKLFQTQSYKKSEFWDELKDTKRSLEKYDSLVKKLKKMNVSEFVKPNDSTVKKFCNFSVLLINDLLMGYSTLVEELFNIVSVMDLVIKNLSELTSEGYISEFKEYLETINELNTNIKETESRTYDLKEVEELPVTEIINALNKVTDFTPLKDFTEDKKNTMKKSKDEIQSSIKVIRNGLVEFFSHFLVDVYNRRIESVTRRDNPITNKQKILLVKKKNEYLKLLSSLEKK